MHEQDTRSASLVLSLASAVKPRQVYGNVQGVHNVCRYRVGCKLGQPRLAASMQREEGGMGGLEQMP